MGHLPAASRMDASSVIRRKVNCGLMGGGCPFPFYLRGLPPMAFCFDGASGGGGWQEES